MRHIPTWPLARILFLLWLAPAVAWADGALEESRRALRESPDFRVRTQAALSLGSSGDKAAVTPLCQALADENRTVRIAVATALGRLAQGGSACLKRRLQVEMDEAVKTSLARAVSQLEGGETVAEPALTDKSAYYIALDPLAGPEVLRGPTRAALIRVAVQRGDIAIAPASETTEQARALLGKHPGVRALVLSPKLDKPQYVDGQLRVKLSVVLLAYPEREIIASFQQQVAMAGVAAPQPEAERDLTVAAAEAAMQKVLALAPTLDL